MKRLWLALAVVSIGSFAVLLHQGRAVDRGKPPIPERVVTETGAVLFTGEDILAGQAVWQSIGGHQVGSIWGHCTTPTSRARPRR